MRWRITVRQVPPAGRRARSRRCGRGCCRPQPRSWSSRTSSATGLHAPRRANCRVSIHNRLCLTSAAGRFHWARSSPEAGRRKLTPDGLTRYYEFHSICSMPARILAGSQRHGRFPHTYGPAAIQGLPDESPMTSAITAGSHMLLTTFRRSGEGVATPVWTVPVSDGRVGMWTGKGTGKWKRLRHDPHVTIQRCSARGATKPTDPVFEGTAEIVESGPLFDEVQARIRAKYGWQRYIVPWISRLQGRLKRDMVFGDTVVLVTVTGQRG